MSDPKTVALSSLIGRKAPGKQQGGDKVEGARLEVEVFGKRFFRSWGAGGQGLRHKWGSGKVME